MPRRKQAQRPAKRFVTADTITSEKNALATVSRNARADVNRRRPPGERHVAREGSLTAAGVRIDVAEADSLRRLIQPWQSRSFAYYDLLGEIKFAAQFYSRALSQLRLYVAKKDKNGDWVESNDPLANELLDRIQDPGGGVSGLLAAYGRLMFLTGEAYLFVSEDPDTATEKWEMLSTDECRIQGRQVMRYKAPSLMAEDFHLADDDAWEEVTGDNAAAYRLWQRHPRYSMLADATMQGVLDLCEELVILTRAVRSRARSRLAGSGILVIDERLTTVPVDAGRDEDVLEDPFMADLTEAMTKPIVEEGSASGVVPLLVRAALPENMSVKDAIAHVQIIDPTQLYPETGLRTECIDRIAIGLDMPIEALKGSGDMNHWTSWSVDEQTWKHHLKPKADQFKDDVTAAYFRPALRALGRTDWAEFAVGYDATEIINHPDKGKDAKDLYDRVAIGKQALREATGFDEEDAPTEEERAERIGILVRDPSLAWYGIPTIRTGGIEPHAGQIVNADTQVNPDNTTGQDVGPNNGSETEPGPPPLPQGQTPTPRTASAANAWRIIAAADLALLRARELAGNRIRSRVRSDREASERIDGVAARDIAATLGHEAVMAAMRQSNVELVAGCKLHVTDALRLWGINGDVARLVSEQVEQHAARTLYEPLALMPATFTPYVVGLLEQ